MQILDCYQTSKVNSEAFGFAFKQATSTKVKVEELDELMQLFRKKKMNTTTMVFTGEHKRSSI